VRTYQLKVGQTYEVADKHSAFKTGKVILNIEGTGSMLVILEADGYTVPIPYHDDGTATIPTYPYLDPKKRVVVFDKTRISSIIDDITSQLAELKEILNESK
jgi:predicted thioesterase